MSATKGWVPRRWTEVGDEGNETGPTIIDITPFGETVPEGRVLPPTVGRPTGSSTVTRGTRPLVVLLKKDLLAGICIVHPVVPSSGPYGKGREGWVPGD